MKWRRLGFFFKDALLHSNRSCSFDNFCLIMYSSSMRKENILSDTEGRSWRDLLVARTCFWQTHRLLCDLCWRRTWELSFTFYQIVYVYCLITWDICGVQSFYLFFILKEAGGSISDSLPVLHSQFSRSDIWYCSYQSPLLAISTFKWIAVETTAW